MSIVLNAAVLLTAIVHLNAIKLPSYITPCPRNVPSLQECATKKARQVLPRLLEGDKSLKIPKLVPLMLSEVSLDPGENLHIKLSDVIITGLEDNNIQKVDILSDSQKISVDISFPRLNCIAKYTVKGSILVLPIEGNGQANITFIGGEYTFNSNYETSTRGNKEYAKLINPKFSYTTKRNYFYLDNLFNGDKALGDQMNKFLNENWQDVSKDLAPSIIEVVMSIAMSIGNGILNSVPLAELLP